METFTKAKLLSVLKNIAMSEAKKSNMLNLWPHFSYGHSFKYSSNKGFDYNIVQNKVYSLAQKDNFVYFIGNNYYLNMLNLETNIVYSCLHYSNSANFNKIMSEIQKHDLSNPQEIKKVFYNGSGSINL
jgi:hypothetical protein